MITGRLTLIGVQAAVQPLDTGERVLVLQGQTAAGKLEVLVPFSPEAAKQVGAQLHAPGVIVANGPVPRV
jgi:hypothetical protein